MLLLSEHERVRLLKGRTKVLKECASLGDLCAECDQTAALANLEYCFQRPRFRQRRPALVLLERFGSGVWRPAAAVLVYEYLLFGIGTGIYAADFLGGARSIVAPRELRPAVALIAAQALLKRRGLLVQLSYEGEQLPDEAAASALPGRGWASRLRQISGYLCVERDLDQTLGRLGRRTRRNLRHYRRLASSALGAELVVSPQLSKSEFLEFSRRSDFAVPAGEALSRYEAIAALPSSVFLGLRTSAGDWLCFIGGYRKGPDVMVEWQINRRDMAAFSLSTTGRAFLLEYAVQQGVRRLYFVRGTTSSIRNSMISEQIVDVVAARRCMPGWLINRIAANGRGMPPYQGAIPALVARESVATTTPRMDAPGPVASVAGPARVSSADRRSA
ncbi:MAG: hypothetical protein M3O02_08490 [Acidobacteriota bacterium]|nr:hypothetical protein [Acidobacteriota bacterium]